MTSGGEAGSTAAAGTPVAPLPAMSDRAFATGCFWVLCGPPLLVAWILAAMTLYALGGGSSAGLATSAIEVGTARVLSCEQAGVIGGWGVGSRQRCTAEVELGSGVDDPVVVELDTGVPGNADVGRTIDVALVSNDNAPAGRRDEARQRLLGGLESSTVLIRNQDRPLKSWSTVVVTIGVGAPVVFLAWAATRSRADPWPPFPDVGVTRDEVRAVPPWACSRRLRVLWSIARWGVLVVVLLTALDQPSVLAVSRSGDGHRWPGLPDAAPLTLPIGGFLLFVAWGVTAFLRSRERVRAAQLLHLGPEQAVLVDRRSRWRRGTVVDLARRAERERRVVGDEVVVRRLPWPGSAARWGSALVAVVAAVLSWVEWARALPVHVQPWWVDVAGTWTAVLVTVVALALAVPDETPVSRARRLLVLRERTRATQVVPA